MNTTLIIWDFSRCRSSNSSRRAAFRASEGGPFDDHVDYFVKDWYSLRKVVIEKKITLPDFALKQ